MISPAGFARSSPWTTVMLRQNSGRPADFGRSRYGESIAKPEVSD
jgi:hypothetical protein